ncbi:uncharacterized protein LOC125068327 [Vanessa atalanta]|uniref:uncharacterized protein LOC125068327 n=1 Tax=Vanessa atalanta TaxID=42275 RepID=UPI001FCE0E2A|nr:uncharacterized protein LOC125068327 [Vanessa atalanta]
MARRSFKITMDDKKGIEFLFDISKLIKHFYETPVIFLTKQDYSDNIFNTMCSMRSALQGGSKTEIIDIIVDFHIHWIYTIKELDQFSKRVFNDLTREEVYQAVSFTIDAMTHRLKYYQRYMLKHRPSLSNESQANLLTDIEIVEEMHKEVTRVLLNKLKCFRSFDSDDEFKIKIRDTLEELYLWIDKITDELAYQLTKYINVTHTEDLTKALQQIVEDLKRSKSPSVQRLLENLKGKEFSTMIRTIAVHYLEISKVLEKINSLEDHISKLQSDPTSAALMALQHKKDYLERRLASLDNLKTTLKKFAETTDFQFDDLNYDEICSCEDFYQLRIFNHALPPEERERLVTELCYVWDLAVFGERSHKSIISILSAADVKEEFNDDLGTFFIDEHSRKIYRLPDDETLYQPNEHSVLVPLKDDEQHIYFYDECGRYFIDQKTRQRIYKAHDTASEYMMDSSGILLKIKEERDGIIYYYDNYGRYYINSDGKHIYREVDSVSEYENDGLGNLVRIKSCLDILKPCPDDVPVTEDFKYLKTAVGTALRQCITDVILFQPDDPIKYLSSRLIKYRENMELKERRAREKEELDVEREIRISEERAAEERAAMAAALLVEGGSEASYDSNLIKYSPMHPDDTVSVGASSFI